MNALDAPWGSSVVSDADHLAAFANLPQAEQVAHLAGWHQTPATQIDGRPLVDTHAGQHERRS